MGNAPDNELATKPLSYLNALLKRGGFEIPHQLRGHGERYAGVSDKESAGKLPFNVLLRREFVDTPYELREYGGRFVGSVTYTPGGPDDDELPYMSLAGYIDSLNMTEPAVVETFREGRGGGAKKMMFTIPGEYGDVSEIPRPASPEVRVEEVPPEAGAVHRYSGSFNDKENNLWAAKELGAQLMSDGVPGITEQYAADNFQFWGYKPPFAPYFLRNEVWLGLDADQVAYLKGKHFPATGASLEEGRYPGQLLVLSLLTCACGIIVLFFKVRKLEGAIQGR